MKELVLMSALADELGTDKSSLRKFVIKQGLSFERTITRESRGMPVLALTPENADRIRDLKGGMVLDTALQNGGYFYIIQPIPELDGNRVKFGYANDPDRRLDEYHTICPAAQIRQAWRCHPTWERAAIDCITRIDCSRLAGSEVYECKSLEDLVQRAEAFFALMPSLDKDGEVTGNSSAPSD